MIRMNQLGKLFTFRFHLMTIVDVHLAD